MFKIFLLAFVVSDTVGSADSSIIIKVAGSLWTWSDVLNLVKIVSSWPSASRAYIFFKSPGFGSQHLSPDFLDGCSFYSSDFRKNSLVATW